MNTEITNRLTRLRKEMVSRGIGACIIPSSDCHMSEYINDSFKYRCYFSGFTGSAGTLFVSKDKGYLITDGRYFLQAAEQLEGTGITLVKQGIEGEPNIFDLCKSSLSTGEKLFADGTVISCAFADKLKNLADEHGFSLETEDNPVTAACDGLPALIFSEIRSLPLEISGKSRTDKLTDIRTEMDKSGADGHVIASLEEIAWILNLRGADIQNTPVFYAFMYITKNSAYVFLDKNAGKNIINELEKDKINVHQYEEFYGFLKGIDEKNILLDKNTVNTSAVASLRPKTVIIDKEDPAIYFKAIKNDTEIDNSVKVHIHDGLAVARFMHWIKTSDLTGETEISCTEKLEEFRRQCPDYVGDSFDAICAYGANGAIVHYSATPESDTALRKEAALLVDSGGQYNGGTTDITRMFILGETTDDFRIHYTTVCKSMLKLQNSVFLKGTKCAVLDMLAREPMWKLGLDYRHGTGHGVGYMLSVHEGPQRIHYGNFKNSLEPGMITSDEPGLYITGKHGIRIENEILCTDAFTTEYGDFLKFSPLTVCPIDIDAIVPEMLDESEKAALNDYHKFVYEKLSEIADESELDWLREYTRTVK